MDFVVTGIRYHRNGVTGDPFFVVQFDYVQEKGTEFEYVERLLGIVPSYLVRDELDYENGQEDPDLKRQREERQHASGFVDVYVVDPLQPENKYRGDVFARYLILVLEQHRNAAWPDLYPGAAAELPLTITEG